MNCEGCAHADDFPYCDHCIDKTGQYTLFKENKNAEQ